MKITVFGAGAIGGWVGALLARKGEAEVSLVARGPHLAAMREGGLTCETGGERFTVHPTVTDDPAELGAQDYVLVTLKAHSLPGIVDSLQPLLGPDTAVVFAQNGIPWWYTHGLGGALEGRRLDSVDPGGRLWDSIGPERAIGCVVWPAAEIAEPGRVVHEYGDRIPLGEPAGGRSDRVKALSRVLIDAGVKAPVRGDLRPEIWLKLWGNLSFNPVSVLTGATLKTLASDPGTRTVIHRLMTEAQAVGEALGARFMVPLEERIDMAGKVGEHRTSMLQDVDTGRPIELDALLGAVIELGSIVAVETPTLEMIYDLTAARAREAGALPAEIWRRRDG